MQDSPESDEAAPEPEALAGRVTAFVRVGDTVRRPATGSSASVRQLLRSYHDCVAGFAPGSGFAEGPHPGSAGRCGLGGVHGWP